MEWFAHSDTTTAKGVAVVIHGLNLNPARMGEVISALNAAGIDAVRLSLQGHGSNFRRRADVDEPEARLEAFKEVSYHLWFEETRHAYAEARRKADEGRVPLFLVGFSYGGLIGLDLLASREEVRIDRAVLFAPALRLHGWDYAIRLFSPFPRMVIPTLSPARYLANQGTSMAAYNALFETLDHFESHCGSRINLPTLVVIDPGDELVSFSGLKTLVREQGLDHWRFFPVHERRSAVNGVLRHIVIDESAVGRQAWAGIRKAMTAHLLGQPLPGGS